MGCSTGHLHDGDVHVAVIVIGSVRTDSVKPLTACFAPQYADCSGMDRTPMPSRPARLSRGRAVSCG